MGHTHPDDRSPSSPTTARRARRALAVAVVATSAVALGACGGDDDAEPIAAEQTVDTDTSAVPYGLVDAGTAADLAVDPDVVVLDVRTPEEFDEGHVDGATMIDFYSDTFAAQLDDLDRDQRYLVYCRSGNRSGQAVSMMQQLGFEQVYDLDGGITSWLAAGQPVVR